MLDFYVKDVLGQFRFPTFVVPTDPVPTPYPSTPGPNGVWPSQTSEPTPARKD